jgi:hypothetical protein
MTCRCYDEYGPAEPAIATSEGWVPFNEQTAADLAASAMLLAHGEEHIERLRRRLRDGHDGVPAPRSGAASG